MKHIFNKNILAGATLAVCCMLGMMTSCDNAEQGAMEDGLYLSEAAKGMDKKVMIDDQGGLATLTVRTGKVAQNDLTAELMVDEAQLEAFNLRHGTNYKVLPADMYEFSTKTVQVKAGASSAATVNINIKPLSQELIDSGEKFAIPVSITNAKGGVDVLKSSACVIFQLDQVIVTSVPIIGGNGPGGRLMGYFPLAQEDYNLSQFAFEFRVNMSELGDGKTPSQYQNQAILLTGPTPDKGLFVRFGFVGNPGNTMNVKIKGSDKEILRTRFEAKKWYHLAYVYDGSKLNVYVNGELDTAYDVPGGGGVFNIGNNLKLAGSPAQYFKAQAMVSEFRFWSRPITPQEIKNNMFAVSPQSEGLEGYWKMNEGSGVYFKDATGKNPDGYATPTNDGATPATSINWKEGVRSDEK